MKYLMAQPANTQRSTISTADSTLLILRFAWSGRHQRTAIMSGQRFVIVVNHRLELIRFINRRFEIVGINNAGTPPKKVRQRLFAISQDSLS
ncbi:hypothetical protein [Aeromonas sp. FDAARGOS 1402]|uniref:hypothetical protein n=1 Tax=Aeromonas sp. FDAARGOS 1402 TaxID=2778051 RepID=UPI001C23F8EA|nr:hypothetical protein [Aeromonas sp. FDAARGOS 1402]QWZ56739.1 hypothetical protein I6L32_23010 [Aeromonas sp. FDAARGOS 1402]